MCLPLLGVTSRSCARTYVQELVVARCVAEELWDLIHLITPDRYGPVMNESDCPPVGVKGPIAAQIADWSSMVQDLTFTAECCERLAAVSDESQANEDALVRRALWQAAVISYGRVFDKNGKGHYGQKREPFPKVVLDTLTEPQQELHDDLRLTRNQHIGHRVDDREQAVVNVYLTPPDQGRGVVNVGALLVSMAAPTQEYVERVRNLAAYLAAQLNDGVRHAQNKVLEQARRDLDRLYEIVATREQA